MNSFTSLPRDRDLPLGEIVHFLFIPMFPGSWRDKHERDHTLSIGSIFGKRALLAIDHIMLASFWSYVPNMK